MKLSQLAGANHFAAQRNTLRLRMEDVELGLFAQALAGFSPGKAFAAALTSLLTHHLAIELRAADAALEALNVEVDD